MPWQLFPTNCLRKFSTAWDRLNEDQNGPPFLSAVFINRATESFGTGKECLAAHSANGRIDAMCVIYESRDCVWQTFQPSQLPLGAWLMERGLNHTDLVAELFHCLPGFPLLIGITQQDPMLYPRPQDSDTVETLSYQTVGWIEIDQDFGSYWNHRSKHLRQNMRTQTSRLTKDRIAPVMDEFTDAVDVLNAISHYSRMESQGWKGRIGTALAAGSLQESFYRSVLEDFCGVGKGRIFGLRFGDRTVAMDLCIESDDTQVLLKTTYDEQIKGLSPSSLLKMQAYQRMFQRQCIRRYEFYGPFMAWTSRWTSRSRMLYHLNVFRWSHVRAIRNGLRVIRGPSAVSEHERTLPVCVKLDGVVGDSRTPLTP